MCYRAGNPPPSAGKSPVLMSKSETEVYEMEKRWNGCNSAGEQIISDEEIDNWNMTVDTDDGTVFYITHSEKPEKMIWCAGSKLNAHLRHLAQVFARR